MQLNTHSKFFYGWQITTNNRFIDFNDGADKVATLKVGTYSSSDLGIEIAKQMNALSSTEFSVSFDRVTRMYTVSADADFELLTTSGVNAGRSALPLLGFTVDKSGDDSYLADQVSGYEYSTQFYIQSYKDTSTNRKAIDGVVNKSASGVQEVIKYGNERFMEGDFTFITNIQQEQGSIIRTKETGLEDFIHFIEWCTEKAPVEFMKDEADVGSFQELVLESTEADSKGLDYDLIELYDRGLSGYFRSGKLKFKLME
jgi:hypothetical protein